MYKMIPWSSDLDLKEFYLNCAERGFYNNSSERILVDSFRSEKKWQVWILYYNNEAIGSVAAHSFDDVMGPNTFRVATRTCAFTDKLPRVCLRTIETLIEHQHVTAQFLIPTCLEWLPKKARAFITSNENEEGTQRLVHRIYCPTLEKTGQMKRIKNVHYRGTDQTVWEIFPDKFFEELNKYPRW